MVKPLGYPWHHSLYNCTPVLSVIPHTPYQVPLHSILLLVSPPTMPQPLPVSPPTTSLVSPPYPPPSLTSECPETDAAGDKVIEANLAIGGIPPHQGSKGLGGQVVAKRCDGLV